MENLSTLEKITELEQKITSNVDLLEVAKVYCDFNYDKSDEVSTIGAVLEIALENQKEIAKNLDSIIVQ